jgi:hypothetical protein
VNQWLRESHEAVYVDEFSPGLIYLYPGPWLESDSIGKSCIARLSISVGLAEEVIAACDEAREVWVWRDTPAPHCYRLKP